MIKEIKNYDRMHLFNHYHSCTNPFVIITNKVDVTNVVDYCKKNKLFYATMGYIVTKTINSMDCFKYRYDNGKIYYCDIVNSNYTEMFDNHNIGYFDVNYCEDYKKYREEYINIHNKFLEDKEYKGESVQDVVWLSCLPWSTFTSLIPPFNKEITIPQFVWDKYHIENGRYYVDLMLLVHHGFADGYHISNFFTKLDENIKIFCEEQVLV